MRIVKLIKEWFLCKEKNVVHSRRWSFTAMSLALAGIVSNIIAENYVISVGFFLWILLIIYVQLSTFNLTREIREIKEQNSEP